MFLKSTQTSHLIIESLEEVLNVEFKLNWIRNTSPHFLHTTTVRTDWVSSSNYSAAGLQGCYNASFGDGDTLLLHRFVDTSAVLIVHLFNKTPQ